MKAKSNTSNFNWTLMVAAVKLDHMSRHRKKNATPTSISMIGTEYGHMMYKSLIICSPKSHPEPKNIYL